MERNQVIRAPALTNAALPLPKRVARTVHNLLHHRRFAGLREVVTIAIFALTFTVLAYMWLGAADPCLP